MDSDDELRGASDSEIIYISSDGESSGGVGGYGSGEEESDCGRDDYEVREEVASMREKRYVILTEKDIHERQEEGIRRVSSVFSIPRGSACILLRQYKWNISKLSDEWFADEERVRNSVGLPANGVIRPDCQKLTCGICFDEYSPSELSSASCGHFYCHECWEGYISTSINDGAGCLALRCPEPSCTAMVLEETINRLAKDEDKVKYKQLLLHSYIEDSRKIKWCPAPDCTCAVEFLGDENYDVSCMCRFSFCWNCTEETHRPVSCETVSKWILKNSAESENVNWIIANSKPCPKCKKPIEKNQGCMHMTCRPPCNFQFCWLCLGPWSEHGSTTTGGNYACNRYESAKKQGIYDEAEAQRERAKNSLVRYTHYYERWASNQTSRQKAQADMQKFESENLAKLSDVLGIPETQLKFIPEAWSQIVECRRVLKWTYAYGYYLDDEAKSEFFVYLQGEAESGLERLHKCAEKDIHEFLPKADKTKLPSLQDFSEFRVKLAGLTSVTRTYFENLVQALEAGLEDVRGAGQSTSKRRSNDNAGANGKKPSARGRPGRNKAARTSR
uniref:Uncharacterized protein n=1 Tax=Avena sativa TaxID=4498 RepID=A0ACD5YG22_AVESA